MNIHVNTPYEIRDGETIRRAFTGSIIKSMDKETRQIEFVISTATIDRYGDIITVGGWDLKMYKQNPVVLFGHHSSIPPIAKAMKTWKEDDSLRSIAQFMPPDLSAFADSIYRMYVEGYLRAVSVGFRPIKYEAILDDEGNPTYSYRFLKQELLEFSAVPIPANPEALNTARQKGIDTLPFKMWAEEMLDNWTAVSKDLDTVYGVGRKDVENIRRRAAGSGASIQVSPEVQDDLLRRNLDAVRKSKAEKAAAKLYETVELAGEEHELPVRKLKEDEVLGKLVFTVTDGVLGIEQADDFVQIVPDGLQFDDKSVTLTTEIYEGGSMLCINFNTAERQVSYELIGVDDKGDLFASKVKDSAAEDRKDTTAPADVVVEAADGDSEELKTEVIDKNPQLKIVNTLDPSTIAEYLMTEKGEALVLNILKRQDKKIAENVKSSELVDREEESEHDPEPFPDNMGFVEAVLCDFEESLVDGKQLSKRQERKKLFLAEYMRELADRLDGGVKNVGIKDLATGVTIDKTTGFTSSTDVNAYLKNLTDQLQPMLAEIITSKLAQLRGRLD